MIGYQLLPHAKAQVDEIFDYTYQQWGEAQAVRYFRSLQLRFAAIASRQVPWRKIPEEAGVDGYYCRYEHHFIYWRVLSDGSIGIATILHERMSQAPRLRATFGD